MTEIPEHLLRRSRERREALGLSTGDEGAATPPPSTPAAAATPSTEVAPAAAATPAPAPAPAAPAVVAPPPKPPPPYVEAALRRKRIPYWAIPVVALLPLWAFIYQWSLTPVTKAISGPARQRPGALRRELLVVPPPDGRRRLRRRHRLPAQRRLGAPDLPRHGRPGRLREVGLRAVHRQALRQPRPAGRPARRQGGHAGVGRDPHRPRGQRRRLLRARGAVRPGSGARELHDRGGGAAGEATGGH